ncbi:MAG: sensor domain-containing diguanylate cyclase, partial [Acholeplasmataceae bacterium]|nr:sensor domain-containing diguanylate cyclase [Acholeplasmataceae bacterium]
AEINGNLVFIRNVNADEISYLSGIVELPLIFKENVIVNVGDILFEQVDGNYLQISKTIEDLSGNHNLMFQTIIPNDYGVVLDKTYNQIIIVIISIAVFFSLVIIIFLDRRVFNRLSKLSSNIQNLANRKNLDERLPLGGKIDEITVVSNEINLMLDKIRESEKEINKLAYLDHLTQQPNRLYFYDILNQAIEEAKIKHQVLSVLFLDLDFFKNVNDTYGHFIGDAILVEVSKRLMDNLNPESTLARTGGDEFLLLVKNTSDVEIELLVKKMIQSLKTELEVNELGIKVSTSIGIAMFPKDGLTRDQLIKNADNAMYQAKSSGKNTYRFWVKEAN